MKKDALKKSHCILVGLMLSVTVAVLGTSCAKPTPQPQANQQPVDPEPAPQVTDEEPITATTVMYYRINDQTVSEEEFSALMLKLEVDPEPYVSADLINPDMGYGGWEAGYNAKDRQTGEAYQLYETEIGEHHSKSLSRLPKP